MILPPPRSTRTDTLLPYTTRCRAGVGELAEPWTTITRPAGVGLVLTLTAKSALAPAARDAAVQVNVAERGLPLYCLLHCQPAGACTDAVAVIVLPSITSVGCAAAMVPPLARVNRSEEHTSELQSLMRTSYAVFCLKKKT